MLRRPHPRVREEGGGCGEWESEKAATSFTWIPGNLDPSSSAGAFAGASLLPRHHSRTREGARPLIAAVVLQVVSLHGSLVAGLPSPQHAGPTCVSIPGPPRTGCVKIYRMGGAEGVCVVWLPPGARAQARGAEDAIGDKFNQQSQGACPMYEERGKRTDTQRGILQFPSPPMRGPATRQCFLPRVSGKACHERRAQKIQHTRSILFPFVLCPEYLLVAT